MKEQGVKVEELLGPLNEVEKKNAPSRIFFSGNRSIVSSGPRVSVVGSRKASPQGIETAQRIARYLAAHRAVVVSGLAEGIDTAAHVAAMSAGGATIAVLGTSLEEFFPAKNRSLQERIMRDHLAVSQFSRGIPSRPGNFPMRNRTMALLSDATVIVEAGEKSGSLHQGWEALRLGRPLFILESAAGSYDLKWPGEFIAYGALTLPSDDFRLLSEFLPERSGAEVSTPSF